MATPGRPPPSRLRIRRRNGSPCATPRAFPNGTRQRTKNFATEASVKSPVPKAPRKTHRHPTRQYKAAENPAVIHRNEPTREPPQRTRTARGTHTENPHGDPAPQNRPAPPAYPHIEPATCVRAPRPAPRPPPPTRTPRPTTHERRPRLPLGKGEAGPSYQAVAARSAVYAEWAGCAAPAWRTQAVCGAVVHRVRERREGPLGPCRQTCCRCRGGGGSGLEGR